MAGRDNVLCCTVAIIFLHNHYRVYDNTGDMLDKRSNKHCLLGKEWDGRSAVVSWMRVTYWKAYWGGEGGNF